jgi:hypothetical protein
VCLLSHGRYCLSAETLTHVFHFAGEHDGRTEPPIFPTYSPGRDGSSVVLSDDEFRVPVEGRAEMRCIVRGENILTRLKVTWLASFSVSGFEKLLKLHCICPAVPICFTVVITLQLQINCIEQLFIWRFCQLCSDDYETMCLVTKFKGCYGQIESFNKYLCRSL